MQLIAVVASSADAAARALACPALRCLIPLHLALSLASFPFASTPCLISLPFASRTLSHACATPFFRDGLLYLSYYCSGTPPHCRRGLSTV